MKYIITESQYKLLVEQQSEFEIVDNVWGQIVDAASWPGTNEKKIISALSQLKYPSDFIRLSQFFGEDGSTGYNSFDSMINGEFEMNNHNDIVKLKNILSKLGVTVTFNEKNLAGIKYFNKGFKSSVSMASQTAGCKTNVSGLLGQAKNWWIKWLSDPSTKQKFKKNWKAENTGVVNGIKVDDIFKNYINIINNAKPDYYTENNQITLINKIDLGDQEGGGVIAFVHPVRYGRDKIFINCTNLMDKSSTTNSLNVIIHELQHLLYDYVPLNPEKKISGSFKSNSSTSYDSMDRVKQVLGTTPSKLFSDAESFKGINMKNMVSISKRYNISEDILKNWYKDALGQTAIGTQALYVCNETEKLSNFMSLRKTFNVTPNQNISYKLILPYIKNEKTDVDASWLIRCWVLNGFSDIATWFNNLNQLAYQKNVNKSNNYNV